MMFVYSEQKINGCTFSKLFSFFPSLMINSLFMALKCNLRRIVYFGYWGQIYVLKAIELLLMFEAKNIYT